MLMKAATALPAYNDILSSTTNYGFTSNGKFMGSYRMSMELVTKIMQDRNLSSNSLCLLIMLLQIADHNNCIHDLYYKHLILNNDGLLRMPKNSYYWSLQHLELSGYIKIIRKAKGSMQIQILHNDIKPNRRYLYLNRNAFIDGTKDNEIFCELPTGAKKLYIYFLLNAPKNPAYTVDVKRLTKMMHLKTPYLLGSYVTLLEQLLGPVTRIYRKQGKYSYSVRINHTNQVNIETTNSMFQTNQLSYYRYMMDKLLHQNKYFIALDAYDLYKYPKSKIKEMYYNRIYNLLCDTSSKFKYKKNYQYSDLFKVVVQVLNHYKSLSPVAIRDISQILSSIYA